MIKEIDNTTPVRIEICKNGKLVMIASGKISGYMDIDGFTKVESTVDDISGSIKIRIEV